MSWGDFIGGVNQLSSSLTGVANSVGNVVEEVNEFELPEVKTRHNFGLDKETLLLVFAGIALLFVVLGRRKLKRLFR